MMAVSMGAPVLDVLLYPHPPSLAIAAARACGTGASAASSCCASGIRGRYTSRLDMLPPDAAVGRSLDHGNRSRPLVIFLGRCDFHSADAIAACRQEPAPPAVEDDDACAPPPAAELDELAAPAAPVDVVSPLPEQPEATGSKPARMNKDRCTMTPS
jgi:hypothetical protein